MPVSRHNSTNPRRKSRHYGSGGSSSSPKHRNKKPQFGRGGKSVIQMVFAFVKKLMRGLWRPFRKKFSWKRAVLGAITLGVLAFALVTIYAAWISRDLPDPNKLGSRQVAQSTKIYDRTGDHLLYEIFADKKRTIVELEDIPSYAINAAIAVEDSKFYEHRGIRLTSIFRAAVSNLLGLGSGKGGASTLTQQLVKNTIVGNERSINRKIKEAILSLQLERKNTKQEILKLYFNEIPYGSTNYGIEAAAQSYFGKSSRDLTLDEAATLAGIVKAPTFYLNNPEKLTERRNFVLTRMVAEGFITQEQADTASDKPLELKERLTGIEAPHFVLHVRELLTEQFGEKIVETGGLNVITTLDYDKHKIAEEEITRFLVDDGASETYNIGNAALTAIDPKTGQVLVMVGSRDFFDEEHDGQVNVALRPRQPGSSFKPFVYTAGFEKGYTPETLLYDAKTNFDARNGASYSPTNYDGEERGPITARAALQGSLNIPAVKMLYLVGVQNMVNFAQRFGYSTFNDPDRFGLSMVLGGAEVKLLEHAAAYAALANEGVYHKPSFLLSVKDPDGSELFKWKERKEKAIEPELARTINNVMADDAARAYIFGLGSTLTLPGRAAAAKTGTTNDFRDGWTLGFTPQLAAGVWSGNNDNSPMTRAGGTRAASPIWNRFMQRALEDVPAVGFGDSIENDAQKAVLRGTDSGKITLLVDTISGKLATSSTPDEFIEERTYLQPHSILHYLKKDDPRGDPPSDPSSADPQYTNWESAVQEWITAQQAKQEEGESIVLELPPTEYDDVHDPALAPSVTITTPPANSLFSSRTIIADVDASAPRGIAQVRWFIDDLQVKVRDRFPFSLTYNAKTIENGEHTLIAKAYDDVGNVAQSEIPFSLDAPPAPAEITWRSPKQDATYFASSFPLTFTFGVFKPETIDEISVAASKDGQTTTIFTTNEQKEEHSFEWASASPGEYTLSFSAQSSNEVTNNTVLVTIK